MDRRRSRSPRRSSSPRRHHHHHRHHRHERRSRSRSPTTPTVPKTLPFNAAPLSGSSRCLEHYKPLFALYLDLQKQRDISGMDEREVRGRWKGFVRRWNTGELAEGWYDTAALERARNNSNLVAKARKHTIQKHENDDGDDEEDEDDDFGPSLPSPSTQHGRGRAGPGMPVLDDLQVQRELEDEERQARASDLQYERKLDRREQKERLEELVPRAPAGTRERQQEKKREKVDANRSFANLKTEGDMPEVRDNDLMGAGEDDSLDAFKRRRKELEQRRSEKDIRKEEVLRARAEERERRVQAYREKEERTMDELVKLAKARFG